jgi:hypothetical protein
MCYSKQKKEINYIYMHLPLPIFIHQIVYILLDTGNNLIQFASSVNFLI